MPKIKKLILRNFRGIRKGEVTLNKGLTILIGPNNSGKTSILEAILLAQGIDKIMYDLTTLDALATIHKTLEDRSLDHLIYGYGTKVRRAIIGYELVESKIPKASIIINATTFRLGFYFVPGKIIEESEKVEGEEIATASRFSYGKTEVLRRLIAKVALIRHEYIRHIYKHLRYYWTDITGRTITQRVADWISNLINEKYLDITAEPFGEKITLYLYRSDRVRIRLGDLGDGVQLLIASRILIEDLNPDIVLWDDVESHMNPRSLTWLAEWLADLTKEKQVVLTTHSLEALETIANLVENTSILKLTLTNGILNVEEYNVEDIEKLKKLGIDIRA